MGKYLKEYFGFADILVMNVLFVVGLILTIPHFNHGTTWLAFFFGMLMYSCSEYIIHRFLFHLKPPKSPFFLQLLKRLHYDHHVRPDELHLLFLPVWYSLPLIGAAAFIFYLCTGNTVWTTAFTTGVIGFLLYYEWTHYAAHRPIQPMTSWGRWMKRLHLLHHFKNENYWFGVTNPSMDMLMGTFKQEKAVEKSQSVRNLELTMKE
ncbi:sterol desaturase family protein [Brevibacillus ginsengisoli]|uniref:sterol desaturase family protein n=1 Tax=Brevibacillus ginsengisoli TaxID=363854 RepID=UPI003CEEA459